jgi:hypothetical protein
MLRKITPDERAMIESWIETHGEPKANGITLKPECRADFDDVFYEWAHCNRLLSAILDDQLIISKPVEITLSDKVMEHRAERQLIHHKFIAEVFWPKLVYLNAYPQDAQLPSNLAKCLRELVNSKSLARNEWAGDTFTIPLLDGKTIRVEKGAKVVRLLGKLAKAFELPGFEEFRILHSQVMNDRVIKGDLCLSVHPLDFLTMSDNTMNWSSCMRFASNALNRRHPGAYVDAGGCYRVGTVEMMNSPYIIEAYIRDRSTFPMPNGQEWSNKKWRTLIYVSSNLITSIKSYPYQSSALSRAAVDWVRELATKNQGWTYEGETATAWRYYPEDDATQFPTMQEARVEIVMETDRMYNDFGECTFHYGFIKDNLSPHQVHTFGDNYSGARTCLWCGKVEVGSSVYDELHNDFVICSSCSGVKACDCCTAHLPQEQLTLVGHRRYCPECLEEETTIDIITGERRDFYSYNRIYLLNEEQARRLKAAPIEFDWGPGTIPHIDTDAFSYNYSDTGHPNVSRYFNTQYHRERISAWHTTPPYFLLEDCTPAGLALFSKTVEE